MSHISRITWRPCDEFACQKRVFFFRFCKIRTASLTYVDRDLGPIGVLNGWVITLYPLIVDKLSYVCESWSAWHSTGQIRSAAVRAPPLIRILTRQATLANTTCAKDYNVIFPTAESGNGSVSMASVQRRRKRDLRRLVTTLPCHRHDGGDARFGFEEDPGWSRRRGGCRGAG